METNIDPTEDIRKAEQAQLNARHAERADLAKQYGTVYTLAELQASDHEIIGFMAPYVVVKSKSTGKMGSLQFQHQPRYYFNYEEDKGPKHCLTQSASPIQ